MNPAFWQGKRVFLTGHTGFKGGWLSLWLQQLGADVTGYALAAPTTPSLFEVADVASGMQSIIGDVRDGDAVKRAMAAARPDIVIHMAAQPLVRYSYANPVETYSTNVMGVVHVLEAVRATPGVRAVVNVTSDKCYENREWPWGYRENEAMGGYDPYSNSKGCAELVTAGYRSSFFHADKYAEHGVALGSGRAGNVIGGGDWALDRLIPDMLRAIGAGEPVMIRNPHAIRPWQHVLEPLSGYLTLAEKLYTAGPVHAEGWNFGPHDTDAKPVEWIIERMTQEWGAGASWSLDGQDHPHEATYLKLDCSKARGQLGWHPRWDIGQTIAKIVEWHKACDQGADMRAMTLAQIATYQNT
ncbi:MULTISPECIES: CDP-glucose 4,6-dehydratase [unclassified Janthinobacterium]|uniref:CDP-glucose 4,6-dehydratase n=1 Tax=unclassified Janthinobacterium TaxID=2610881 RepID=UPI000C16C252|nr:MULTISPECIES: CDP-glucose 4,6-dehydratase [unclassified Janthinobacterium]MDN2677704.1 CDP-glucose 4,6-dehydratase [Janthinobacterium sp. SUN033]MDN2679831.1 CDP-glucose 4,6-dehydratase [Janthinobacterium sp. SUN033]MDN2704428.1 CDP-glucose 4,6-dehydratase [Janthinobacterium sp. SUN100]MDO8068783.1 CDP-glucose 4,6-dehydratase [Janthinobacterium sp. SUN206]MDO8073040.1 CDP-glucose 4,6-dehydratase [Janthinobacterium sp. SUN176]